MEVKATKKLIVCTIKPERKWLDIAATSDYLRKVSERLYQVVPKEHKLSFSCFDSGSQNHEVMEFSVMTELTDEYLLQIVNDICSDSYDTIILT